MNSNKRALVSGGSIAGPALAYWLQHSGWEVTVVERADAFRAGGQNIDVRGAGREVLRRMSIEDEVRARHTKEVGTQFIGRRGEPIASFPAGTDDTGGATAEVEILRGELSRVLVEASKANVTYRYGTAITELHDTDTGVHVTFNDGTEEEFDIVVVAEGMRSRTRKLVFPDADPITPLGMHTAYLTIPRTASDTDWWRWYSAPGGRAVTLRPDNLGTVRATLSYPAPGSSDVKVSDDIASVLRSKFRDVGWETPRILENLETLDEIYLDRLGQVHLDTWHRGNVVLVGDAAYCASPVSGMGTTLSLVGAYVLAGELGRGTDTRAAFQRYEQRMRPFVAKAQDLPPGTPRLANPHTRVGIAALHTVLRLAASRVGKRITGGLFAPPADTFQLPDYS